MKDKLMTVFYGESGEDPYLDPDSRSWHDSEVGAHGCLVVHLHTEGGNNVYHVKTYAAGVWREVETEYV